MRINIKEILDDNISGSYSLTEKSLNVFKQYIEEVIKTNTPAEEVFDEIHINARQLVKSQPNMALLRRYNYTLVTHFKRLLTSEKDRQKILDGLIEKIDSFKKEMADNLKAVAINGSKTITNFNKVLTISNSTVVKKILRTAIDMNRKFDVVCLKSDPPNEGVSLAEELVDWGIKVTLVADSQAGTIMEEMNLVLVGADRLVETGFVNKAGTLAACLVANHYNVPVYLAAETTKILKESERLIKKVEKNPHEVYSGKKEIEVCNSYFEKIPLNLVSKVISEEGVFETPDFISWYLGD
jgi:translation initiation factor 2B subunit (eIF-2B alpha/beta/delta family)